MRIPLKRLLLWGALILVLDLASKWATNAFLPLMAVSTPLYPYGGIPVFRNFLGIEFSLSHLTNTGAAWGAFGDKTFWLLTLRLLLISGLIVFYLRFNQVPKRQIPLTLIIAGALGNVLDLAFYGHVIDMFHFIFWGYDYPVFNIADSAICIGAASLILSRKTQRRMPNEQRAG